MPVIETPVAPISLLDAVNMLLEAVKLASVMSLVPAEMDEAAGEALRSVGWASREVQLKGWHFNTLRNFQLNPNNQGIIQVPASYTIVVPDYETPTSRVFSKRNNQLIDLTTNTFVWDEGFKVKVIQTLEFSDVPEPFRWFITAKAGRRFGLPRSPDTATFRFTDEVVKEAEQAAEDFDGDEGGANLASTSPHFAYMRRKR